MSHHQFDLVVLGGGSGGYAAALRAAQLGMSVALIEREQLGGTCLHRGCIPTKALLHAAGLADTTRSARSFGVHATYEGVDLPGVYKYRDGVVAHLFQGLQGLIASRGITLVEGNGRLLAPHSVAVSEDIYVAGRAVVLATGSCAKTLPGVDVGGRVVTSGEALDLAEVPRRAIVLGGGVIGVEFASMWRSFGAEVTVVEALPRLIPNEDAASSRALERAFRKRGIAVWTDSRFAAARQDSGEVTVSLEDGETLSADVLLVAVGRDARTEGLGLAEAGVQLSQGFVVTDERLQTNIPTVYAVGDIVPGLQLAHRGFQQGIFVAEEIAGLDPAPVADVKVPRVTYCDPEVSSVGLTQEQAVERYGAERVETMEYNLAGNGKSQILGTAGFIKLVREKRGPVVGVHMVGGRVGELTGEAQLAVEWEAHPEDVAAAIHAHPTENEALGEAFLALAGKSLHAHG